MIMAKATTPPNFDMDDYQFPLPGFRFHPTDEELVDYYLRRKVEKKLVTLELIKQIDIYQHNPWDLPFSSGTSGEKECYVFVKRGRKYKNSVRPNRVTGSGFWKATGIDKPIYSQGNRCIGLKKTLVFYKGSAGRGIKTEWMMHEFRLPPNASPNSHFAKTKNNSDQEAEIWTLCRIIKRSVTCRRYTPNWKEIPGGNKEIVKPRTCYSSCPHVDQADHQKETYISFSSNNSLNGFEDRKPFLVCDEIKQAGKELLIMKKKNSHDDEVSVNQQSPASSDFSNFDDDWDELRSIVDFSFDPFFNNS